MRGGEDILRGGGEGKGIGSVKNEVGDLGGEGVSSSELSEGVTNSAFLVFFFLGFGLGVS